MSTYSFFQSYARELLTEDAMVGPNPTRKVIPDCITPVSLDPEEQDIMSVEEKVEAVLSDPKFGMFSLFAYQVERGYRNTALKKQNVLFCSHIFSLMLALPLLVFSTQWLMYIAIVINQVRTYDRGSCPNEANIEEKMMMAAISVFYFIKSFFLWDGIVDRTHRRKKIASTSIIVMFDTFQEFGFNLLVYGTNLWIIFAERDFLNMFFNTLAMEFLMDMDNEFERMYFTFLPEVAVDIYDSMFVSYRDNLILVNEKTQTSRCFRCCHCCAFVPYKLLMLLFMMLPFCCFVFIIYGTICK